MELSREGNLGGLGAGEQPTGKAYVGGLWTRGEEVTAQEYGQNTRPTGRNSLDSNDGGETSLESGSDSLWGAGGQHQRPLWRMSLGQDAEQAEDWKPEQAPSS